jgi:hypothetical protein
MDSKQYLYLTKAEGEADLCTFIIEALADQCEMAKRNYNADPRNMSDKARQAFFWRAKALEHAMLYVEDWKNSI